MFKGSNPSFTEDGKMGRRNVEFYSLCSRVKKSLPSITVSKKGKTLAFLSFLISFLQTGINGPIAARSQKKGERRK